MKHLQLVLALFAVITFSSCYTTTSTAGNSGKVPPGQMKKATGSKSARPYAPGQNKY
ncbi:hypothetical protein [Chitinophaga silvisoli]|uniref:hypothetical protein n=1 Tax=Chitinophaga silvisoli TaxID=2291814 RepID=UPI0018F142A4|nr:hypothetical protein [Chitinophaga silvisoli]